MRSSSYYSLPEFVIEDDAIASSCFDTVTTKTSDASFSQKNMHNILPHNYQTAVVRLLPRGEGDRFGSALGSGGGILTTESFKDGGCSSAMVRIESAKFVSAINNSVFNEAASSSSAVGFKTDSVKEDHLNDEIVNLIDESNNCNATFKRVNFL